MACPERSPLARDPPAPARNAGRQAVGARGLAWLLERWPAQPADGVDPNPLQPGSFGRELKFRLQAARS
jgi:hypothetical protein